METKNNNSDILIKAMGSYQMLLALAPACGPLLGGYLAQHYQYQGIFIFLSVVGVILLITHLFYLPKLIQEVIITPYFVLNKWQILR